MGLGDTAQRAIRSVKRTWTKGGIGDLQISVVGRGALDDLRRLPESLSESVSAILGPLDGSNCWISRTPYVPPRFLKKNGRHSIQEQIRSELQSRLQIMVANDSIEIISPQSLDTESELATRANRHRHYVTSRSRGGRKPPSDLGYTIRFSTEQPVSGPICLGYGSHFGLGVFETCHD